VESPLTNQEIRQAAKGADLTARICSKGNPISNNGPQGLGRLAALSGDGGALPMGDRLPR